MDFSIAPTNSGANLTNKLFVFLHVLVLHFILFHFYSPHYLQFLLVFCLYNFEFGY